MSKSTSLRSCVAIVFLTYFSHFFAVEEEDLGFLLLYFCEETVHKMEKIDSVLYHCVRFEDRLVELKDERLLVRLHH